MAQWTHGRFGRSTGTSKDETTLAADAQAAYDFALPKLPGAIGRIVAGAGHGNVEKALGVQAYSALVRAFTNAAVP